MIDKLRKRIGSAPWLLVMSAIAVLGAVIVLSSVVGQGTAQAQSDGLPPDPFAPSTAPGAPSDVVATANSASQVTVAWMANADGAADGYEIERKTGSGDFMGLDPAHSGDDPMYVDGSVSASMSYTYRVRATNSEGVSDWVESNEATTPAAPPPPPPPTEAPTPMPTPTPTPEPVPDGIASSSTGGGSSVKLTLTIGEPGALNAGSSVALYLEDDFQVGDIDMSRVYFVGETTGRVYVTDAVVVDDDDHFGGDDDWDLQIFVPDMNPGNDTGFDSWSASDARGIKLVLDKAGVKNPTEAGSHSVGYTVLAAGDSVAKGPANTLDVLKTYAKISLNDEDAGRGKEITVTGSGFNNGTGAEVFVLGPKQGYTGSEKPSCRQVVLQGDSLGTAAVGSDDKFTVTFTVHQDEFAPGAVNHICAADSEAGNPRFASREPDGATSGTDNAEVDTFDLEASVTVSPSEASYGDEITLKPRDFGGDLSQISLGPKHIWNSDGSCPTGATCDFTPARDGSDYVFDLPGDLDQQIQIAVKGGPKNTRKTTTLNVAASSLKLSMSEVAPNASVIISGSGFNKNAKIYVGDITIDDQGLHVDEAGTEGTGSGRHVRTTSNGQFTATVRIWTADSGVTNPALDDDEYTIKVVDEHDFEGEATIMVNAATVSVTPETVSPRDFIVISGENWPISTADMDNSVTIEVDGRTRSADVDSSGRFRYEYQLRSGITIGEEHDVTVTFDGGAGGDIEEEATFSVTEAGLTVNPAMAAPGQTISIEIEGMPPYTLVEEIRIDGANRIGSQNVNTDREGNATVSNILVPFLDPGFYPVEVRVGNETRVAQLEVLAEAGVPGVAMALPDAAAGLGDNLEAIFHFNNTSKEWTFFDPRPEFADLNTLSELNNGQPYWVLVGESQEDVLWNGRLVDFTCAGDDCWNLEIW